MSQRPEGLPKRSHDLTGHRFGKLVVVEFVGIKRIAQWRCRCDCGNETVIPANRMQNGQAKSCGCTRITHGKFRAGKGHNNKPERNVWMCMIARCTDPRSDSYPRYGGAGVTVCERWMSFENFLADMGSRPTDDHSIDRIDGTKGYEPGNCRWATRKQQMENRSITVYLELNGVTKTLMDWAEETGIPHRAIRSRIRSGWTIDEALTTPVCHEFTTVAHDGLSMTYDQWATKTGISARTIRKRIAAGWSVSDALTCKPQRGKKRCP